MYTHKKTYHRVLTIAGSDSGGGAGIQADLKTISALGCYGLSVITALTAQNTKEVRAIHKVPASFVADQIDAVAEDIGADAVKIGMLQNAEIVETVADKLENYQFKNVVLDPVMVAKSGDRLLSEDAVDVIRHRLLHLVDVITPNLPEARILTDIDVQGHEEMAVVGQELLQLGARAVLIKGGHAREQDSSDCLCKGTGSSLVVSWYEQNRIDTQNTHGTGCTLSSAIAAFLAKDESIPDAVQHAKTYITQSLEAGAQYELGSGHGPVHHFHDWWT
jgi:hydroxymethylpyrimidine/phosphomethylpyrimidine kinase